MTGERVIKYLVVLDVVRGATVQDTPDQLAARVRRRAPTGTYEPVRICEDIGRIIRQDGHFTKYKARVTPNDSRHAGQLRDSFRKHGLWLTR